MGRDELDGETMALQVLKALKYAEYYDHLIKKYGALKYCSESELKKLERFEGAS